MGFLTETPQNCACRDAWRERLVGFSELAFRGLVRKVSSLHFEIFQKSVPVA